MSKLNDNIIALSTKIEAAFAVDKSGVGTVTGDVFHDNLPETLTKEVVAEVDNYKTDFIAASTHAFGQVAVKAMKENSGLENASIVIPMSSKDTVEVAVERSKTFNVPKGDSTVESTQYGSTTVSYTVHAGKNAGQLKVARSAIKTLAAELLAKA